MAFPLAELLTRLGELAADTSAAAPTVDEVNLAYDRFRRAEDDAALRSAAGSLCERLEAVAVARPALTSRAADLQSRVAEILRSMRPRD